MQRLLDKCFLLICSAVLYYFTQETIFFIIPVLIIAGLCAVSTFLQNRHMYFAAYLVFLGLCCFFPLYTIFLPVLIYDLEYTIYRWSTVFCILPVILFWDSFSPTIVVFCIIFLAYSIFLYSKTSSIEVLENEYSMFRQTARELQIVQEEKNKSILENQDYEIRTATLNERNRISKEIHDHVGHVLSRALLQIGALLTISREEPVREGLSQLKNSISEGMDSIRASVHNMHDESIDLKANIEKIVRDFSFCQVDFVYDIHSSPMLKLKYCFIASVKEAFSNIIKHSNASQVKLSLTEDENAYRLEIADNGTVGERTSIFLEKCQARNEYPDGLGLQSIHDRIKGFSGSFLIETRNGFHITIIIPKEDTSHESLID